MSISLPKMVKDALKFAEYAHSTRAHGLKYRLAEYLGAGDTLPFSLEEAGSLSVQGFNEVASPYIAELVEQHTNLQSTAYEKLNACELIPFLQKTLQAISPEPLEIEPQFRTIPLTKSQAASYMGIKNSNPSQAINRRVEDGTLRIMKSSGLTIFDYRDFPLDVWENILHRATLERIQREASEV